MDSSPMDLASSPERPSRNIQKRNPSITPRRFGRFFTPRQTRSSEGRALATLDDATLNRLPPHRTDQFSPGILESDALDSDPLDSSPSSGLGHGVGHKRKRPTLPEPGTKRRGALFEDILQAREVGALRGDPLSQGDVSGSGGTVDDAQIRANATLDDVFKSSRPGARNPSKTVINITNHYVLAADPKAPLTLEGYKPRPIRKLGNRCFEAQLLNREHGFSSHPSQRHVAHPACDYRATTASFYSRQTDLHHCVAYANGGGNTIPFSLASLHKHRITAIGDEQGFVRYVKTDGKASLGDEESVSHIRVHDNAIMDLALSEDDMRLATASGDRTARIVDMPTQHVVTELKNRHWDSLRQVTFQPGPAKGNVLATSDRAGQIQLWDLRCPGMPIRAFSSTNSTNPANPARRDPTLDLFRVRSVNTIDDAHIRTVEGYTAPTSVTALHWLPTGREHLLLTGSEANACVKLWDTRFIKPRGQKADTPLATTRGPSAHNTGRPWGITSLAIGGDATRLYSVCKDSTVYAYSLQHLVLGHAPEFVPGAAKRRPANLEGLGPLYGFRHNSFHANSFYVKCAVRPASNNGPELLAVGSSDSCAVVFPTDERYLRTEWAKNSHNSKPLSLPISQMGTPLIRGHSREVTTVGWTNQGGLVTASDDYIIRHWQEGNEARRLRQVGEFGGERHMAGWSDVSGDWDEQED